MIKFENLQRQTWSYFNPSWVKNLSDRNLSQVEERVLSKGLNFVTHHSKKDTISLIANVDDAINR